MNGGTVPDLFHILAILDFCPMKALVLEAYNKLIYKDFPDPVVESDEVLIKVEAAGICGSDVHGFEGLSARRTANVPLIMGHEFTGTIVELPSECHTSLSVGERVVVQPQINSIGRGSKGRGCLN